MVTRLPLQQGCYLESAEIHAIGGFNEGDCFHNGNDVLGAVREMHKHLKQDAKENDLVPLLLDHIVDKVLRTLEWRPNAPILWHDSQSILDNLVSVSRRAQIDASTSSRKPALSSIAR